MGIMSPMPDCGVLIQNLKVGRFLEEADDACGDLGTDIPDGLQLFRRRRPSGRPACRGCRESFCRLFPDMTDAESKDQAVKRRAFRPADRVQQIRRRFFGHPFKAEKFLLCQEEEVGRVMPIRPFVNELSDHFSPSPSMSSAPGRRNGRYARGSGPDRLCRCTGGQLRPSIRTTRAPHSRAGLRHDEGPFSADSCGLYDLDDFGNDVSGPLNHHRIPDADIFFDLVLVVEGRPADHDAADADRSHNRNRRQDACPSDLDDDILRSPSSPGSPRIYRPPPSGGLRETAPSRSWQAEVILP